MINVRDVVTIRTEYEYCHESSVVRAALTPSQKGFIKAQAERGLAPYQICEQLRGALSPYVSWSQVYHIYSEFTRAKYERDPDTKLSLVKLCSTAENLRLIHHISSPFSVGVLTNVGLEIMSREVISEYFIDSTTKTNCDGLELFTVLGSYNGSSFPISYLILQQRGGPGARKKGIADFFKSLADALPNLDPLFFFTDKDEGQIDAIGSTFNIVPSLCYWHAKRAIKRKLHELQRTRAIPMLQTTEKELMDRIDMHYNLHPLITRYQTVKQIRVFCVADIAGLYCFDGFRPLLTYLMENWYDAGNFAMWGRRNTVIAFTRTTMMVEGHWYLLKRHHLVLHNRPRPDFVLHIIDQKLLPRVMYDYKELSKGVSFPKWLKDFMIEWRKLRIRDENHTYETDKQRWICSCPAYLRNRFMLCKHLIDGSSPPNPRSIVRSRLPPFYQELCESGRRFPLLREIRERTQVVNIIQPQESDVNFIDLTCTPSSSSIDTTEEHEEGTAFFMTELARLSAHIYWLNNQDGHEQQMLYLRRLFFNRISLYVDRVEESLRSRRTPITYKHADTTFLP